MHDDPMSIEEDDPMDIREYEDDGMIIDMVSNNRFRKFKPS